MKIAIAALISLSVINIASANVIITGTRVIYPAGQKETTVQLVNRGASPSLIQAWIDDGDVNSTPETAKVPFLLTPPVVKVDGFNGQQLRLRYTGSAALLPADKESVFYLNVLDIPPAKENTDGKSIMQIAVKSRIKIFYRPLNLPLAVDQMHSNLFFHREGSNVIAQNDSPYYASIATISVQGKEMIEQPVMIAPRSTQKLVTAMTPALGQKMDVVLVDDYGTYQKYVISLN